MLLRLLDISFISIWPNKDSRAHIQANGKIMASIFMFSMKRFNCGPLGPTRKESHAPCSLKASCKALSLLNITPTPPCTSRLFYMCSYCHLSEKCGLASVSSLRLQTPSHWASILHSAVKRSNWKGRISLALQRCKACHAQEQLTPQQLGGGRVCNGSCLDGGGVPREHLPSPRLVWDASKLPKQGEDKIPWQASWPCL